MTKHDQHDAMDTFQETVGKAELFFERNQKMILYIVAAIVLLIGGYFGLKYLYVEPQSKAASEEMFYAERYFEMDSLDMALKGDNEHLGMLDIISNYKFTSSANNAHYYVGVIYLKQGKFDEAISYLKKFKSKDIILSPMAKLAIADAQLELEKYDEAAKSYMQAAAEHKNDFVTPMALMRAAAVYEKQNKLQDALTVYERIRKEHPQSSFAREIDKYIARVKELINN